MPKNDNITVQKTPEKRAFPSQIVDEIAYALKVLKTKLYLFFETRGIAETKSLNAVWREHCTVLSMMLWISVYEGTV